MTLPFEIGTTVIGMAHLPPLPGSPKFESRAAVRDRLLADAAALEAGGVDAIMVENFGDVPFYPASVPKHIVAEMTSLVADLETAVDVPLGVNVLRNDAEAALAIASATSAEFIRVNVHSGARVSDQGVIHGQAHETMRLREQIETDVAVFADVDVKHSTPLGDSNFDDEFRDVVERGLVDAVVVTGDATGDGAAPADLERAGELGSEMDVPVFVGSGVDRDSVDRVYEHADGAIIGTSLKENGAVTNPVDIDRVADLVSRVKS